MHMEMFFNDSEVAKMLIELVLLAILVFLVYQASKRPIDFPPGPRGLPFVGYAPFLNEHHPTYPFIAMQKLSEIYGPVVGCYLGPKRPFISVCGYEAVREALLNEDLDGRPHTPVNEARTFHQRLGIAFVDGEIWQEQRRFTMRHLKDLGFGKTSIESQMMGEIHDLMEDMQKSAYANGIVNFKEGFFNVSVLNVFWAIVGGEKFQRDDPELIKLLNSVELFFRGVNVLRAAVPVPTFLLKIFPFVASYFGTSREAIQPLQEFILKNIQEHEQSRSPGCPRDFIDVYLDKIDSSSGENQNFSILQLAATISDIFSAGEESTSNTTAFAILHLINSPESQRKMQAELDAVCGDCLPTLSQKSSLPFTEAVLMEVQRMSPVLPFTLPHCALKETQLLGYTIPKDSLVSVNLHSVFHDTDYWKDPEVFYPERFLNEEGKLIKSDHLFPFGLGKRLCPGESLAKNTYFLFTASLMKRFQFKPVPEQPLPTLVPNNGLTLGYKRFEAVVVPR